LGAFKTLSQDSTAQHADMTYISESPGHVLSQEKNPACPRLAQLRKLHLKLKKFFQPAGFFTEMLRFDKKFQRKFQRNLLATLKIALDQKSEILEKSRKNKIFIKSRPACRLCLKYQCPTL
jgi:hypothetical protein